MSKKVLVAYASKYGSTEQIAERIGLRLKKAGLDVDIRPV
jgi:menaquinone-dependent protoporphyrinogen oxidase